MGSGWEMAAKEKLIITRDAGRDGKIIIKINI